MCTALLKKPKLLTLPAAGVSGAVKVLGIEGRVVKVLSKFILASGINPASIVLSSQAPMRDNGYYCMECRRSLSLVGMTKVVNRSSYMT
ncbi:hypothetical protein H8S95_06360 [Pontibacter sp. KCTC 32443]|uniref:hypothetical protein n=1 Tax=Pontibacter TaxID=323449 RepID=UPI00164E2546|nr:MULTISPECIES: hypothetical protein [Pontibacter]MBC5773678.1 hypothetical protein [Pontibacter sp. KCTC 32443]